MTASTVNTDLESQAARLSMALGRISRWIRRQQHWPLAYGALSALATVSREGPLRAGDLAVREGLAPASLSRIIAALVADGYVAREPDPNDGRSILVTATPAGDDLLAHMRGAAAEVLLERLDRLDAADRSAIIAALPALEALAVDPAETVKRAGPGALSDPAHAADRRGLAGRRTSVADPGRP
jgi:DNA-binding MarR family transcriptional regulator